MAKTKSPMSILRMIGKGALIGILLFALLVLLAFFFMPKGHNRDHTQAVNNARQIGLALLEFEQSYGRYPNDTTASEVKTDTKSTLPLGSKSSNDLFRQLIAEEITQSEDMFYAKIPNSRRPDNQLEGKLALEKGECGFSYLIGSSEISHPGTPIVVTPLVPGKALFDYKSAKKNFYGKAVILRYDGSVQSLPIDKSGRVWINGKNIFDPTQPFWNGKPPIIKWPDV